MAAVGGAAAAIQQAKRSVAAPSPQIRENNTSITRSEEEELRRIEAEADGAEAVRTIGKYQEKVVKKGKITQKPWFILDPRTSKFVSRWDSVSMCALIFTAVVTFVEVAFVSPSGQIDSLFITNRCVDGIFFVDLVLQFLLMYPHQGKSATDTIRWIHDPPKIARHYLKTWFCLDSFSIAVSGFDFLSLDIVTGGESSGASSLKAFRIVRVARLVKLVRLVRSSRIMKRLESRMAINYNLLALVKCLVGLLLAGHWFACIWGLICTFESPKDTWYTSFGYCTFVEPSDYNSKLNVSLNDADPARRREAAKEVLGMLDEENNYECVEDVQKYMAALYWAIMTITSIGYGDIAATNTYEQAWCTFLMLFGGMIWGAVIATFCGVIANLDPAGTEFRKTMDDLNTFMALQGLPKDMRIELRQYFHQTKHLQIARANKALIENMSPMLQGQVVWKINERWLRHVWFLRDAEDKFMVQLSLNLAAAVFAPAELCPNGYMYISHRGIALYGGKVLTSGKVWGEDMILSSAHLRSKYAARCMTYVEVYMISRDDLLQIAKSFPPTLRIIRRSAFRLAFRREMIRRAQDNIRDRSVKAGQVQKSSAADRLMVQISSREGADPLEVAAGGEGGEGMGLPPIGEGGASIEAFKFLMDEHAAQTNTAISALEGRLTTQHTALVKQLGDLATRVEAALSKAS